MRAVYSSRSGVLSECVAIIVDELEREIVELRNQMTACETQQERSPHSKNGSKSSRNGRTRRFRSSGIAGGSAADDSH